ncbi:unnamed protein product, partial [Adineta ricciae]
SRPPTSGKGNGQDGGGHAQATSDAQLPTGEVESAGRHRRSTASSAAPRSVREDFATHGIPPDDGLHCRRRSAYERVAEELRSGHGYLPREPSARYRSPQINAHDVRHYEALPSPSTSSSYVFSSRLRRSRTRFGSPSERFYLAQIHPALFTKHVSRCGASSLVRAAVLSPTWSHDRADAHVHQSNRYKMLGPLDATHSEQQQLSDVVKSIDSALQALYDKKLLPKEYFDRFQVRQKSTLQLPHMYFLAELDQHGDLVSVRPRLSSCQRCPVYTLATYLDEFNRRR